MKNKQQPSQSIEQLIAQKEQELKELKEKLKEEYPQRGSDYYFINTCGEIIKTRFESLNNQVDAYRLKINNFFRTSEEAQNRLKWILLDAEIREWIKIRSSSLTDQIYYLVANRYHGENYSIELLTHFTEERIKWWLDNMDGYSKRNIDR